MAFHLPEKINTVILIVSIYFFFCKPSTRPRIPVSIVLLIIISFILLPELLHDSWEGATYLISFLTIYFVSQGKITPKVIRYSGLIIAGLGLVVLFLYVRGTFLSGWNENAISMVGLFSFIYFSIFLIEKKGSFRFWIWNIISLVYVGLLFDTDCRSGMLFSIIAVAGIFYMNKTLAIFNKSWFIILLLNAPLIIALFVIWISESSYFSELNDWSLIRYGKPIFNGRENLWDYSFTLLEQSDYLGTGRFRINYHNSGMAALSVFGVLGYISWILYFKNFLNQLKPYILDNIVFGSFLAFCLIFLQQSVELGFISPTPNLLPYMILGVGLGRIRLLKESFHS